MRYQQLMILSALATFAVASTIAAGCIGLAWRKLARATRQPAVRARALLALRVAPVAFGALTSALALLAFVRHEPRATAEVPGLLLIGGAGLGASLILAGLWRAIGRYWNTRHLLRTVERSAAMLDLPDVPLTAWQVDVPFPLIAVAGIWRSRLLVARSVLAQMPADELEVVMRHELAHARHHDNIAQLLLIATPRPFPLGSWWRQLEHEWRQAVEEAADDFATGTDPTARLCLASALVRVARLAGAQSGPRLPLLAFHEGESIGRRVRRLVEPGEPISASRSFTRSIVMIVSTVMIVSAAVLSFLASWDGFLRGVHDVVEWLINARP
jgi:hypothetical protein